jgi:FAD/FMN-containing dehydrogenase
MSAVEMQTVVPGDRAYESVRHVYSAQGSPARVLLPTNAEQVAHALQQAQSWTGPLSIRSGGHGISSIATNDGGTVIDLRHLSRIEHLGGATVTLGPGARWGAVAEQLGRYGLALTSGDSGDVGVGGLATTGGIGLLGRMQGLTIDRIRAVDMVTADGRLVHASPEEHPELFWAVRGAGANVGIVTRFVAEAGRTPVVARASVAYELERPAAFLAEWGAAVEAAPREISAFLYIGAGPAPFAQATIVFAGDDTDAATRALAPFTRLRGVRGARAELVPYASVPLVSGAPHSGQQSAVMHTALVEHLDEDVAERLAAVLAPGAVQMVQIRSAGGAINDIAPDATAYAHRHQNFSVTAVGDTPGARFDTAWEPMRARRDGIYLSFESNHRSGDIEAAFPGPTLARLREVKSRWDPAGIFSQNFDVTPQ